MSAPWLDDEVPCECADCLDDVDQPEGRPIETVPVVGGLL